MLSISQPAPDFNLPDCNGKNHSLSESRGKWVLVYFYPKDDTPGCTKEACSFRDAWTTIQGEGLVVLGISTDSPKSHLKFIQKYNLPFTLLADEARQVVQAYGAWGKKTFMGKEFLGTKRISFLIDPKGVIRKIVDPVTPETHATDVLNDLKQFRNNG